MKKLFSTAILCVALCALLALGAFASEADPYGYLDLDHNGKVEFSEALEFLDDALNNSESDVSLVRIMHSLQAVVAGDTVAATINSVDTEKLTATISSEYFENVTVPLSVFGLDGSINADDYNGVPATIAVHGAKNFANTYDGSVKGIYAAEANLKFTETPENASASTKSMNELNTNVTNGSHANDSLDATSLEMSFRDNAVLSSEATTYSRYDNAWYPRVKKVNDNLYLLLFMYSQTGQHLYYATSSDGTNWNAPQVLWNSANYIINAENSERYFAMNADACVLEDGSILCVFAVRDEKNYRTNPDGCGLAMVKGTADENNEITWSEPEGIYTGQVWEPSILLRDDGQLHIYFTQVAPDIVQYGFDEDYRSTEVGFLVSNDNGETWSPDIQPGDTNYYRATAIYREFTGEKADVYTGEVRQRYNGQMPVAVQLANGKIFMAVEIKNLDGTFRISSAISGADGEWDALAVGEESTYTNLTSNPNSSPYVSRFPSGEIYLTHNYGGKLVGKLGKADASDFGEAFNNAPDCAGIWGSCSLVGSHKMVTAMQNKIAAPTEEDPDATISSLQLFYHYLNHRITAKEICVNVDGYRNDWALNTEALFVGSESQAQAAVQFAHDKENIYFYINRLDYYLSTSEKSYIYIADANGGYYKVEVGVSKSYTVTHVDASGNETDVTTGTTAITKYIGTPNINGNIDTGMVTELSVPKSVLGITNATSIKAGVGISNTDRSVVTEDTMVDLTSTENWPTVVLED